MTNNYEYTEADIDKMIAYIKTVDPENATPEMAIRMLETEFAKAHLLEHEEPEIHAAIYEDFTKNS